MSEREADTMGKPKTVDLLRVSDSDKTKLIWEIRRQIQQQVLEENLTRSLLKSHTNMEYPEGISLAIEDMMRKAVEELRQKESIHR